MVTVRLLVTVELDALIVVEPQFAFLKSYEWRPLMNDLLVVVLPQSIVASAPDERRQS